MTMWEFNCAVEGCLEANGATKRPGSDISDDRLKQMGIEGFD